MEIIIRSSGERTESACARAAAKQGNVHFIREAPFGKSIYESYMLAIELGQKWTPIVDADVLLYPGMIEKAIRELESKSNENIFCLDGKTDDKIMLMPRRAGIHIYQTSMLPMALNFIDNDQLKPESHVRREMADRGYKTYNGGDIVFGQHDYEQYYADLWRKSICQIWKLAGMIEKKRIKERWAQLSMSDPDYTVVIAAHLYGKKHLTADDIRIDKNINYNAEDGLKSIGLTEKEPMK